MHFLLSLCSRESPKMPIDETEERFPTRSLTIDDEIDEGLKLSKIDSLTDLRQPTGDRLVGFNPSEAIFLFCYFENFKTLCHFLSLLSLWLLLADFARYKMSSHQQVALFEYALCVEKKYGSDVLLMMLKAAANGVHSLPWRFTTVIFALVIF